MFDLPKETWAYYDPRSGKLIAFGPREAIEKMIREDLEYYAAMYKMTHGKYDTLNEKLSG